MEDSMLVCPYCKAKTNIKQLADGQCECYYCGTTFFSETAKKAYEDVKRERRENEEHKRKEEAELERKRAEAAERERERRENEECKLAEETERRITAKNEKKKRKMSHRETRFEFLYGGGAFSMTGSFILFLLCIASSTLFFYGLNGWFLALGIVSAAALLITLIAGFASQDDSTGGAWALFMYIALGIMLIIFFAASSKYIASFTAFQLALFVVSLVSIVSLCVLAVLSSFWSEERVINCVSKIVCFVLCAALIPMNTIVFSQNAYYKNNFDMVIAQEKDGIAIVKNLTFTDDLHLPNEIDGKPVIKIGQSIRGVRAKINAINLYVPDSVKAASISPKSTVETIHFDYDNSKLTSLEFSSSTSSNTTLRSVGLPKSLKIIGKYTFYKYETLIDINLENITEIKESAFESCTSLLTVKLQSIKRIEENAFENCIGIRDIYIGESIQFIEMSAFNGWTNAQTIHFVGRSEGEAGLKIEDGWWAKNNAKIVWNAAMPQT